LLRADVKALYPAQRIKWHGDPAAFEIDGHWPVREMWHRGSLAWRAVLADCDSARPSPGRYLAAGGRR
jgi:hypothetical protein